MCYCTAMHHGVSMCLRTTMYKCASCVAMCRGVSLCHRTAICKCVSMQHLPPPPCASTAAVPNAFTREDNFARDGAALLRLRGGGGARLPRWGVDAMQAAAPPAVALAALAAPAAVGQPAAALKAVESVDAAGTQLSPGPKGSKASAMACRTALWLPRQPELLHEHLLQHRPQRIRVSALAQTLRGPAEAHGSANHRGTQRWCLCICGRWLCAGVGHCNPVPESGAAQSTQVPGGGGGLGVWT